MFSYYGGKSKLVDFYPSPKFGKIIEPFAGTARYALKYFDRDVLLVDKYEVIIKIWKWLQICSPSDILKLPNMKPGENTDNYKFDCQEAKHLMGFIIQGCVNAPRKTVSSAGNFGLAVEREKKRISKNLFKIKHWEIRLGSYEDIANEQATWFIDPPPINSAVTPMSKTTRDGIIPNSPSGVWKEKVKLSYVKTPRRTGFRFIRCEISKDQFTKPPRQYIAIIRMTIWRFKGNYYETN